MGEPLRVGVVGLGKISEQYFTTLSTLDGVRIVAVADLDEARAGSVAASLDVAAMSVDQLMADPGVDAVLNLTVPAAHADICLAAVRSGKHAYVEKPLALATSDGQALMDEADAAGVRVGCAPDTVLGTGIQTARALLDSGEVGHPVGASAVWVAPGHELWHPAPDFYYQPGAGPLFDMGPYYATALVTLLGPVVRVSGHARRSGLERVAATGPSAGRAIAVAVDTHVTAVLVHESGVSSSVTMSFDVWASRMAGIEVYATAGTIAVPDPNTFSEPVEVFRAGVGAWEEVPDRAGYRDGGRGIGLADMAAAIAAGTAHRASGEMGLHVLDVMAAVLEASRSRSVVDVRTSVERPPLVAW